MYHEFGKALSGLKNGKSEGIDNISAELLKALGRKKNMNCLRFVTKENGRMILWNQLSSR